MKVKDESINSKLLECAKAEFMEKGFADASMRTIAERAGVTTGMLYSRFADKDEMFCSIVGEGAEKLYAYFSDVQENFAAFCDLRIIHGGNCRHDPFGIKVALEYGVQICRDLKVAIDGICVMLFAERKHGVCFPDLSYSVDEKRFAVCRIFPFVESLFDQSFHGERLLVYCKYTRSSGKSQDAAQNSYEKVYRKLHL